MLNELVLKNRSYRAFDESRPISERDMRALVELARFVPSGMNKQPLRYRIVSTPDELAKMYANSRYAAALSIKLPPEGQKPTGFIAILRDTEISSPEGLALKDCGIAAQTILLAAVEMGFGGCMLGSFDPAKLSADLSIPQRYQPLLVLALGTPSEQIVLEDAEDPSNVSYYRDAENQHHVPKRKLEDILL
ncbi:MAG: nitroreductase family protein [Clostridia bacterium]|nr:nitroreductase family protein [Clostridia bacterium]